MRKTKYTIKDQNGIQIAQTWSAKEVENLREPQHKVTAEIIEGEG